MDLDIIVPDLIPGNLLHPSFIHVLIPKLSYF